MRKQTVDIVNDLVSDLEIFFEIKDSSNYGLDYLLETDCTWWLSIGDTVEILGIDYKIVDMVMNVSITIEPANGGALPLPNTEFMIPAPTYIHGTLKMAQNEVDAITNKTLLVPFVYLFEVIRDRKNTDTESMIDRETDLRLFFLNSANTGDWLTDDHYINVINPMQQMVDLFIRLIEKNRLFTDNISYDCLPLINVSETGTQDESVFDCNLSGIELRLSAEIREDLSCENKCKC